MDTPGVSALRPLAGVRDAVATLRIRGGDAEAERSAFLRVSAAIEASLRRMLRDEPGLPLETRLRALAADEMALDEVVATLRKQDRLSAETMAGVQDLAAGRRRVGSGGDPSARDLELAVAMVARLEREAHRPGTRQGGDGLASAEPRPPESGRRAAHGGDPVARRDALVPAWIWGTAALAVLGLVVLGFLWGREDRGPGLSEGVALFRSGDFPRAAAAFEQYVGARPDDPTGRLFLARVYRRMDRREEAGRELRSGLELAPDDAALHRELGLLLLDAGQAEAAVGRFRTAVELDPEATANWLGLIRALRENGQPTAAENIIARAPPEVRALVQRRP